MRTVTRFAAIPLLTVVLSLAVISSPTASEKSSRSFYVATNGSDTNPGTLSKPFATLERAREAIRGMKKAGQFPPGVITVYIRGGIYALARTFELTASDSGTQDTPIVYRAYGREHVRLIGGKQITGFKPIYDAAVLNRIPGAHRREILQVNLSSQGITDFGHITARGFGRPVRPAALELFFEDKPMQLARWPNGDWAKIAAVPAGKDGGKFTYEGNRPERWSRAEEVWLHGYWTWDWAESYERVKTIDTGTREIATYEPHGVYGYSPNKRYYALNLLEELDEPGEWYLDRGTGALYFWPPTPIRSNSAYVSILEEPLVSMRDASYIALRNLSFEITRGTAVEIVGGAHSFVAGCTFRNIGNLAVSIAGGSHNGVVGCDIYQTGDGAIRLSGGDRRTLTPASNYAVNNHIHDYSRWVRTYRPAVLIAGVGNRIANNLIHDAPHSAIILGGNDHVIEFNEIHHVCMETSDAGAFYLGRDFTERGNVVRYNFFHHLGESSVQAIYLDDCASGTLVFGNICYRAGRGVLLGGGRDNTIENNIFVDCNPAVHVDARGLGWAGFWFDGRDSTLMDRLKAMNHTQPPYSTRYPQLRTLLQDEPAVPKGNKILRNICFGGRWLDLLNGLNDEIIAIQDNFTEGDPRFVSPEKLNFQLKPDSPAYKLGFKPIPVEKIGLYRDDYRPSLPTH